MSACQRRPQRRNAAGIRRIRIGAMGQQDLHHVRPALLRRQEQGSSALNIPALEVDRKGEQPAGARYIARRGCLAQPQWRIARLAGATRLGRHEGGRASLVELA